MKDNKKVLQPVLQPTVVTHSSETVLEAGYVEVEVSGSGSMVVTQEMWDRVYSKRENFTLKKK